MQSRTIFTRHSCADVHFHTRKPRKARWRSDDELEGQEESSEFDSGEEAEAQPKGATSEQEDEGRDETRDREGRTTRSTAKVG